MIPNTTPANRFTTALLILYLLALCWIILFKLGVQFSYMDKRSVNIIPFNAPSMSHGKMDTREMIANAIIFMPLGLYAGVLFRRWSVIARMGFFLLVSATIEALQYILRIGAFDVTDVIMNVAGGMAGLLLYHLLQLLCNDHGKTQRFINAAAALATVLVIGLLVLLKLDMLPVKYR